MSVSALPRAIAGCVATAALALSCVAVSALVAPTAFAQLQTEEELLSARNHWQEKYRHLLRDAATRRSNIEKLENDYAQAQRRNYPRGGAREKYRIQADQERKALAKVEMEIETIFIEARQSNIPPGWLYSVEDEPITAYPAASASSNDSKPADRDGRNPLYLDDE